MSRYRQSTFDRRCDELVHAILTAQAEVRRANHTSPHLARRGAGIGPTAGAGSVHYRDPTGHGIEIKQQWLDQRAGEIAQLLRLAHRWATTCTTWTWPNGTPAPDQTHRPPQPHAPGRNGPTAEPCSSTHARRARGTAADPVTPARADSAEPTAHRPRDQDARGVAPG